MGWNVVNRELGEFIEILPPQKRMGEHWYLGTADAVWQNLYAIERERPRWVIVLAGDHIYKMDYGKMLDVHIARGARADRGRDRGAARRRHAASACSRWTPRAASPASTRSPSSRRARPGAPAPASARWASTSSTPTCWCASCSATPRTRSTHDFGRDIIPRLVSAGERVFAYLFWDENKKECQYWRDVGTIDAYFEASMDLVQVDPVFNLYDPDWPMRTYQPQLPPAKFVFAEDGRRGVATESVVSMGCIVSGSEVRRCVLCPDVRIHSYCEIEDSILLPGAIVNRHCRVRRAIIDRGVELPRGRDRRPRPRRGPAPPHRVRGRRRGGHPGRGVPRRPPVPILSRGVLRRTPHHGLLASGARLSSEKAAVRAQADHGALDPPLRSPE